MSGFFPDGDVDFPAPGTYSFGAAAQPILFEGDELPKPGIRHFVRGGSGACVGVNVRQAGFAVAHHLFFEGTLFAGAKNGGWPIDKHLDKDEQGL